MAQEIEELTGQGIQIPAEQLDIRKHNAVITVYNREKGTHRTLKIHTVRKGKSAGARKVSLLTGSDNYANYEPFAFLGTGQHEGKVFVFKSLRSAPGQPRTIHEKLADMLERPTVWQERGVDFLIAGTCRRCNHRLTRPDSILDGMGAECRSKSAGA